MANTTTRARREATKKEFARALGQKWKEDFRGTSLEWKSGTIVTLAEVLAVRTEDGWKKDATRMSDVEIFQRLGMVEELEVAEEETTEATETTEDTEETELTEETKEQALVGAQKCIDHWTAEEDEEMATEARERYQRILDGTANEVDIQGALDWLDYEPDTFAEAIGYIASQWGTEETEDWLAHNEGNEAEAMAETLVLWQEEADAEGTEPVPAHLLKWANEQLA